MRRGGDESSESGKLASFDREPTMCAQKSDDGSTFLLKFLMTCNIKSLSTPIVLITGSNNFEIHGLTYRRIVGQQTPDS